MTMKNIQTGFECTGIYPLNRDAIVPMSKDATVTLTQCTWLKFIPLYSPARQHRPSITQEAVFTEDDEFQLNNFKKIVILLPTIIITNGKKASIS